MKEKAQDLMGRILKLINEEMYEFKGYRVNECEYSTWETVVIKINDNIDMEFQLRVQK